MIDVKGLAKVGGGSGDSAGIGEIGKQITLPWSEAFRISLRNVMLRLGRAAITAVGVILGIAFLVAIWTQEVATEGIQNQEAQAAREQAQAMQSAVGPQGGGAQTADAAAQQQEKANAAARLTWLVVMSLLVSTVGITNAMLMSVTERFREIGTMKCLGALDSFIIRLFLIESVLVGLLGSIVGAILGHSIMLLWFCVKQGWSTPAKMNWPAMLAYIGIALAIGTVLSFVAAVAPAMRAAKMPPAAALATEV